MGIGSVVKKYAVQLAKKNKSLRKIMRYGVNALRKAHYQWNTRSLQVDDKLIVFNGFNGKAYACTPKAVYEYMLSHEEYSDYRFVWVVRDLEKYAFLAKNPRTELVLDRSKAYDLALGSAKYWIFNYRIYDYIFPKKEQVYVQCWHGTPLKRLGYDIVGSSNAMNSIEETCYRYRMDAERFRYILSPSAFASEKFSSAWNLKKTGQEDKIVEVGYPRDDFLINYQPDDVKRIKEAFQIPEGKKILLYAPTWRDNQHQAGVGYTYSNTVDFEKMRKALGEEWVILFRAHYLVASKLNFNEFSGFVYNVSEHDDVNELYVIADLLMTDYSSVFFDYANLKKPMIFYMYDLAFYQNDLRGFYIDLNELPGPIVEQEDAMIEWIQKVDDWFTYDEKYRSFNEKFNYLNDGKASKRLLDAVLEK